MRLYEDNAQHLLGVYTVPGSVLTHIKYLIYSSLQPCATGTTSAIPILQKKLNTND